jgi:hypothetical protein
LVESGALTAVLGTLRAHAIASTVCAAAGTLAALCADGPASDKIRDLAAQAGAAEVLVLAAAAQKNNRDAARACCHALHHLTVGSASAPPPIDSYFVADRFVSSLDDRGVMERRRMALAAGSLDATTAALRTFSQDEDVSNAALSAMHSSVIGSASRCWVLGASPGLIVDHE